MTRIRAELARLDVVLVLALVVALLGATGCGAAARQKGLRVVFATVSASETTFLAWDELRQVEIVRAAATREEAEAELAAHRARRDAVLRAYATTYHLLAAASYEGRANVAEVAAAGARAVEAARALMKGGR